jgi:hypothetical protein
MSEAARHRFALFRLAALLRSPKPVPPNVMLFMDRDQSAIDHYAASIWIVLTLTCYIAATLFASWPLAAALLVAFPVAIVMVQIAVATLGFLTARASHRQRINSVALMALLIALAAYFARTASWVRFAAWFFLGVVALNALAAAIVFLLRNRIGGAPSAA